MNKESVIKIIIDKHLKMLVDKGTNSLPCFIEPKMRDLSYNPKSEWNIWLPVNSEVKDEDIKELEQKIKSKLPQDYILFLKWKHFYELYISEVGFCPHPINTWKVSQEEFIFYGYPTMFLIDKGYIPFADWSDWGLLCFDSNSNKETNDYPIVLWDHDNPDTVELKYNNFYNFLLEIDKASCSSRCP